LRRWLAVDLGVSTRDFRILRGRASRILKSNLRDYNCVLLVCVYEDHWEDRGPSNYALHHFKATVVRTYKGNWRVAERVAFVHGVDAPAQTTANADVGRLMFLFTNEHTASEIGVDTGQFYGYDREGEREMQFMFQTTAANRSSQQPSRCVTEPFMETWKSSLQTAFRYDGSG